MYINAGKIRLREIYNDLKAGYELDGRGKRKKGDVRYAVDDNTTQNTEALGNLTPLTYKEYQNLTSNSNANYVHGYNSNLDSFINDAFTNPQSQNKTLYIGKIPQNVAQTIKNLSNSDVSNYSVVIRNGEINKIFNDHGSDLTEIPRGQIAVTPEILAKISEVISNPDKITIKKSTNDNKTVLDFEKRINGYAIATEVISDKRKTLRPITFYVINKKNPPTISNANSLAGNVQNESGTDSDTTIPQSNSDVKYSLDSTGRSLTQAQAEYFKDSKVRDAEGRLETVYHGTPNTFTEFNYNNIGLNGTAMGKGFYFVNNKDFASGYTTENGNIVEAYIDIKKPLSETKKTITKAKLRRYIDVLHKTKEARGDSGIVWDYGDINSDGYQGVLTEATNMTYEYNDNDVAMVNEILNVNGGNFIEDFTILKNTLGYDGIIQSQDANTIYIPFLPNQIKSTDNLNPTENADIRYSLSSDQQSQLDTLAEEHKKRVERIGKQPLNPQDKDKQIKAEGMKYSAAQREIRQGDSLEFVEGGLTEKELRKKIDRLNTNYKGKVVQTVDGETGTVQGTAFGNIRVAMEDGSVRSFKPEQIVENRIPYPTAKQIDNGFGNVTITDKDGSTRNIAPEGIPLRTTDTLPDNVTVVEDEVLSDKYIQFQLNNGLAMVQGNLDFDQGTADIVYYDKGKNFLSETDLRAITEDVATYLKGKDIKTVLNSRKDYILNTIQKELANSGLFADGNVLIEDYNDFEPKPVDIPYEGRVKRPPTSTVDRNGNFINPNRERNVDKAPEKTTTTEPAKFEPSKMPMMDATVAPTTEEALKAELRAQFGDETFENVGTQVFSLPEEVKASNPQKQKSFIEKAQDFSDDVARTMINSGHEVDKMAKAANDTLLTHQYNNIKQARQSTEYNVSGKQTDFKGREIGKSLVEIFQPAILKGEEYTQTFYTYLLHRHNIDRQKQNKPVFGKKYSAIESYAEYKAIENKYPEFVKMAEDVYAYNRNLMDWRVESRLASREDADKFTAMYPHYVPVFRKGQRNNYASDFYDTSTSKTIKKAKGGDDDIEPIHTAMARQTSQVIKAAKENTFGLHMLDLIQEGRVSIDIAKIAQIDGEVYDFEIDPFNPNRFEDMKNTFSFYKDGQKVVLDVNEDLHNALAIMRRSTDDYKDFANAFRFVNNTYKKLITAWNPIFAVKNFVKDGWDSLFYTRDFARFSANYSEAIKQMATNGEMWKQYRALGGFGASVYNYDTGFNENILNPPTGIKKGTKWASDKIEAANYFVEQLPRFTEFLAIVDKAGYKTDGIFSNDISYETLMDAMYGAADITTNFSRSGTLGKKLNATVIPFFNPSVQGFDKLIRTLKGEKGFKGYVNLAAKAALLNILPSLINELVYADDEDYQNLRDSDKDLNYLFKVGDNYWVKIPKGRITGTISAGALRISRALQGDPDAWDDYLRTVLNNIAPINPLTSNIAAPVIQTMANKNWWGGDIVPEWMKDKYEPKDQYDEGTTYFARAIANTLIGEAFNLSPMHIDNLLESYTGVLGDFILPAMTPTAENFFGFNAFITDGIISNDISSGFYDFKTENYKKSQAVSDYTAEEIARYSSVDSFLNKQASAVSDINAEIREIQGSDLTDNEKRKKVRELNAIADGIMENAMAVLPAYEQALIDAGTGDKDTDYLIANYETFGVDYALQTYNKSSYESQLAKGTDLETYYADLVNRKLSDLGEEQIETPRGTYDTIIPGAVGTEYNYSTEVLDKIAGAAVSPEDWAFIDDRIDAFDDKVAQLYAWGFDDYQVGRLTEEFVMGSTARAKMTAASDIGIDKDTYLQGYIFGYQTTGTKQQRNNQIAAYIEDLDLDAGQKAALYNWLEVSSGNGAYSSGGSSGGSGSGSSAQDNTFEALLDFIQKQSKSSIAQPQLGYGEGLASYSPSYSTTQSPAMPTNFDTSALDYIIAAANRGR